MRTNKILLVMVQEIYATLRRFYFLLFAFILPIIMGLVAVFIYYSNRGTQPNLENEISSGQELQVQAYVDESDFIQVFPPNLPENLFIEYYSSDQAQADLEAGKIDSYFIIPADYLERGVLEFYSLRASPLDVSSTTTFFESVVKINLFKDDLELGALAVQPMSVSITEVQNTGPLATEENWLAERLPFMLVLVLYMVVLIPASSLVSSITHEKKNRVLEILLSSISAKQFFVGKLLAVGFLGILQTLVWVGVIWGISKYGGQPLSLPTNASVPPSLLIWAFLYSILGYAMYGTQMAGIGALAPDLNDTRSVTLFVLSPMIIAYLLNVIFLEQPDSIISLVMSLFPLTSPVVMIGRLATADIPIWQPVLALVLQILAVIWIVRLFSRLFRAQALLSGQTVDLKRLIKALQTP